MFYRQMLLDIFAGKGRFWQLFRKVFAIDFSLEDYVDEVLTFDQPVMQSFQGHIARLG